MKEAQRPHRRRHSRAAVPPPRNSAKAAGLRPRQGASSRPILALPRFTPRAAGSSRRFRAHVTFRPSSRLPREPVELGCTLARTLESRWKVYREQLRLCQEQPSEAAVHELRVATRRLLAEFALLSGVVPGATLEKARRTLKRRLTALGDLRDTHVQRRFIEQKLASFPELIRLRSRLKRRERRLVKAAAETVNRCKTRKLGKLIAAMINTLNAKTHRPQAESQLTAFVLSTVARSFAEAVERRQAIDPADPGTIHRTRVAFKRFRYMLESLSPGLTGLSRRQLRALAYYQRKMGIIQDLEVMQACVARYAQGDYRREAMLQRFSRHLRQRRARALRSFLKSMDRLYEFWPPAGVAAPSDSTPTRKAV